MLKDNTRFNSDISVCAGKSGLKSLEVVSLSGLHIVWLFELTALAFAACCLCGSCLVVKFKLLVSAWILDSGASQGTFELFSCYAHTQG